MVTQLILERFLLILFRYVRLENLTPCAVLFFFPNESHTSEVCSILVPFCWLQTSGKDLGQGRSYIYRGTIQCHQAGCRM